MACLNRPNGRQTCLKENNILLSAGRVGLKTKLKRNERNGKHNWINKKLLANIKINISHNYCYYPMRKTNFNIVTIINVLL